MKKIYTILVLTFIFSNIFSQTVYHTRINYIHGMNGTGQSLIRLKDYMSTWQTSQQINPTLILDPISYTSPKGIEESATKVNANITADANYYLATKRIVIAHSMGGLVARQWFNNVKLSSGKQAYNGLITINTPHLGAPIANSLSTDEGKTNFTNQLNDAIKKIIEGPKSDSYSTAKANFTNPILKLSTAGTVDAVLDIVFNKIIDKVYDVLVNMIDTKAYLQNSVAGSNKVLEDLSVASPIINSINNLDTYTPTTTAPYDTKTFKIAFWGDAKDNQVFRMIGNSFYIDGKGTATDGLYTVTESEEMDLQLIKMINQVKDHYNERIDYFNTQINRLLGLGIITANPSTLVNIAYYKDKKAKYERSRNYLMNDFHKMFASLLGLRSIEYITVTKTTEECVLFGTLCKPVTRTYQEPKIVEKVNDGLVPQASQIGKFGAVPILLDKMNHEGVKVHYLTGTAMKNIMFGSDKNLSDKAISHYNYFKLYNY